MVLIYDQNNLIYKTKFSNQSYFIIYICTFTFFLLLKIALVGQSS